METHCIYCSGLKSDSLLIGGATFNITAKLHDSKHFWLHSTRSSKRALKAVSKMNSKKNLK